MTASFHQDELDAVTQDMEAATLPVQDGAVVCMFIGGMANSGVTVFLFTAIQLAIPRHLMGLVMFSSLGLYPVSTFLMGLLAVHFGPALLFPICGIALGLVMLFGMTQKVLREI